MSFPSSLAPRATAAPDPSLSKLAKLSPFLFCFSLCLEKKIPFFPLYPALPRGAPASSKAVLLCSLLEPPARPEAA